jgi:hypothetical protein
MTAKRNPPDAADEAPALPPGGHHDDPDLVLNEHVTEDEVCVVSKALFALCLQQWD